MNAQKLNVLTVVTTILFSQIASANSSWIKCTLYPTADVNFEKVEIVSDSRAESFVKIDDEVAEVVSSTKECGPNLDCIVAKNLPLKVKLYWQEITITLRRGRVLHKESWPSGEFLIEQAVAKIKIEGSSRKMYGTCSSYNF